MKTLFKKGCNVKYKGSTTGYVWTIVALSKTSADLELERGGVRLREPLANLRRIY